MEHATPSRTDRRAAVVARPSLVLAVVAALVAVLLAPGAPADAAPDAGLEAQLTDLVARERAAAGVGDLRVADDLVAVARRHARRMGEASSLHHNPDLGTDVGGWDKVGENVGRGPDLGHLHAAFLGSPSHRDNLLDPEWTEIGIGVEVVDGRLWVVQLFRLPTSEPADPDAVPSSAVPTTEPAAPAVTDAAPPRVVPDVPLPGDRVSLVQARLAAATGDEVPAAARA